MVLLKRRPAHSLTSSVASKCGVAPRDWLQMVGYSGLPPPSVRARVDGLCPLLVRCDLVTVRTDMIERTLSALSRQRQEAIAAVSLATADDSDFATPQEGSATRCQRSQSQPSLRGHDTRWAHLRRLAGVPVLAKPHAQWPD